MFVVEVHESITQALTGSEGHVYVSPSEQRDEALELVALLLGHPPAAHGEREQVWRHAIAGGQRSMKLRRTA